jgi:hypothetical protein
VLRLAVFSRMSFPVRAPTKCTTALVSQARTLSFRYIGGINQMTERYSWKVLAKFDHELRARMPRTGLVCFYPNHLIHEFTTGRLCDGDLMNTNTRPELSHTTVCHHCNRTKGCKHDKCKFNHICSSCGQKNREAHECSKT